ncbi:Zinc transporter 5 [Leucoagaricus sp. SymC.cos]|nr:Zinc transporter 5 [Leucoagaricus sp. SymC.cos]
MAFDCMAIEVGLFTSVIATWESNEQFTYGYGYIEMLSSFVNGIFLILISIFIVFEAIQQMYELYVFSLTESDLLAYPA